MISSDRLNTLLQRYAGGNLTRQEYQELLDAWKDPSYSSAIKMFLDSSLQSQTEQETVESKDIDWEHVFTRITQHNNGAIIRPASRNGLLRRGFFRYAAIILVTTGLGIFGYIAITDKNTGAVSSKKAKQPEILPGGERAVLTLADGTRIILDQASNGRLADQGGVQIVKLANGSITYNAKDSKQNDVMWNTMSTPVGGQYQVILPDGTKVWLNAASSITYPAAFVSDNRKVKITGEVYFEVNSNKAQPFLVDINGKSLIEVLGTSFNINSYSNEENIKTTLLEGSIKINRSAILKPGQQAIQPVVTNSRDRRSTEDNFNDVIISRGDKEKAVAWKNGMFNFNGADLKTVMRQLERWYDIKVVYEGPDPTMTFSGKIYRNVNLSDVLEMFQESGIKFRREGKTIIIF